MCIRDRYSNTQLKSPERKEEHAGEASNSSNTEIQDEDDDDENYNSDDFEDVTENNSTDENINDISITIEDPTKRNEAKGKTASTRNVCSREDRDRRYAFHMADLLCLMVHGYLRNEWLNSSKFIVKLSKLVPEKVFQLLHPVKDEELPLRSTRKLLDGLKKTMELWNKHWKILQKYEGVACYMKSWDEITTSTKPNSPFFLSKKQFIRQVIKGQGDRDIAAQGYVALLRACNVNARLIMSCQPPDITDLKEKCKPIDIDYDDMVKYPIFWCEVWDKFAKKWITIDCMNFHIIEQVKHLSLIHI